MEVREKTKLQRRVARETRKLTIFEFLILRILKRNPGTTMSDLGLYLAPLIDNQRLEKLLDILEKKGLIAWWSIDATGSDLEREVIDKKIFSLTAAGLAALTKANKFLRTRG